MTTTTGDDEKPKATPDETTGVEPFNQALERHGLQLRRAHTHTLQVNVGLLCDLACRHCHLEAGPGRPEVMRRETMDEVIAFARRCPFQLIDITGGAPELVPHIGYLIEQLAPLTPKLILRSNLTALAATPGEELLEICRVHRVAIVASFPSTSASQADAQRGKGTGDRSVVMLQRLNALGWGREGSGLELNLVANPTGAFLPPAQGETETRFKRDAERKWGIVFNRLFTFANAPLGRFRTWLEASGNYEGYMLKLARSFNPCTVEGLMCRSLVSVSWDGILHDCDFNIAAGLPFGGTPVHVSALSARPEAGTPIATGDHCYACTAGSGFT
jgi:radical SAM/Cys-rich protein